MELTVTEVVLLVAVALMVYLYFNLLDTARRAKFASTMMITGIADGYIEVKRDADGDIAMRRTRKQIPKEV